MTVTHLSDTGTSPAPAAARTRRLTTAQALVAYLSVQFSERDGVRRRLIPGVFGIFGHGNVVGLGQALEELGDELPFFQGKNEQAMVHTALGYAKATNRTQTLACAGSVGPGAMNMLTGAGTATANHLPVLLLAADVFMHRRMDPVLQQIEHPSERDLSVNDCFRPVSRFFDRITRPEQLLKSLPEAMRVLTDPAETGAVTISLPQDVQGEAFDFPEAFFTPRTWSIVRRPPAAQELAAAVEAIRTADRPLIVAGGGVRYAGAQEELARFSEELGIPVGETYAGKGCGPAGELGLGGVGSTGTLAANRLAAQADCVIGVGTRMQDFTTGSQALFQDPDVRFVSVNVASHDAHKLGSAPVVGDARLTLAALREELTAARYATGDAYRERIREQQAAWDEALAADLAPREGEAMSQAQALRALNERTGPGDVVVVAAGTPPADVHRMWDVTDGSECHIEFGFSCMGHEIPAGLGYRLARGDAAGDIFVVIGDGTYLMGNTELVTAVQEHLNVNVIVIENGGYQAIRSLQVGKTGVAFGNELRARAEDGDGRLSGPWVEVDFEANARSMGCSVHRAQTLEQLGTAIDAVRHEDGPSVIVVPVERYRLMAGTECFWDVGIFQASDDERMRELSAEHRAGQATQRFYGHRAEG
ncbi:MAG TPA: 3D-(3,5/4)-trihydroxycyclohexane-1,2-dione acylhydrolase (decyclizing) [Conexibacter sp.]|nr:3D-(3,5/4)-trihydroxycyclohexane-1,2-dione acylhydrolase (decyclizing) [Conexibacter sp.]